MYNCWFDSHSETSEHGHEILRNALFHLNTHIVHLLLLLLLLLLFIITNKCKIIS